MKFDNFTMTTHQTCPTKYRIRIVEGMTSKRRSAALGYGGALHEGLASWYKGQGFKDALAHIITGWPDDQPTEDWRTLQKCLDVFEEYVRRYGANESFQVVGADVGQPIVEQPFSLLLTDSQGNPLLTNDGDEIFYGGIFDTLTQEGGETIILDHKTTSRFSDAYWDQFKPNNQMTGYMWAAGQLTQRPCNKTRINCIVSYEKGKTKFERNITTRSAADFDEWRANVLYEANEIERNRKANFFPRREINCVGKYGNCEFFNICSNPQEIRAQLLEQDFIHEPWDYERRVSNE